MKIDSERPYHSNVLHELVSSGGPKVDGEPERESKNNLQADQMVEQTNASEHTFVKAEHQNGGKTRQIRIEDISYDKDVVEINLPDAVVSSDYGGHFVKDVCIDEGVLAEQKASTEKVVSEKVCQNFDSATGDANGDLMEDIRVDPVKAGYKSQIVTLHVARAADGNTTEEIKVDPVKIAHEVKSQIVTLPACATDGNTMEQYSPCEVRDLEGNKTEDDFTNLNVEKLSPRHLSSHEAAKQCQQMSTSISETCETHKPFCDGEAIDEVASNGCHEIGASIASEPSNLNGLPVESTSDRLSAAISGGDGGAELDERGLNPASHYNPFIAYGSLEDTWEAKYALPSIVDNVSVVPICPVGKTDSFSDLVNGGALGAFDFVETAESRTGDSRFSSIGARSSTLDAESSEESHDRRGSLVERVDSFSDLVNGAAGGIDSIVTDEARTKHSRLDSIEESSGRLDVQASEESNDQKEGPVNEPRTEGVHGTGFSDAEPSDAKSDDHPKCETDTFEDALDFNPREMEEDGTDVTEDKNGGKGFRHAQTEHVVQQNGLDSAKLMARTGIRNPFESSFSGASITSDVLAPSAHIGNISLRSDSSTTSTRSFAFPVLQTEWNSSPVKMAKADRRRFRRDRGWGYRVLCCKF